MTKLAIPLTNNGLSEHFGHCETFAIYTLDENGKQILNEEILVPPPHEPGVFPKWLHDLGVSVIIAGGMGRRALDLFAENGITVRAGKPGETPRNVVQSLIDNTVGNSEPTCGHDHDHHCA